MTNPIPHLFELQNKLDELGRNGYDVHTVSFIINGQHGGWDVTIEATDDALEDYRWDMVMDVHGHSIRPAGALV